MSILSRCVSISILFVAVSAVAHGFYGAPLSPDEQVKQHVVRAVKAYQTGEGRAFYEVQSVLQEPVEYDIIQMCPNARACNHEHDDVLPDGMGIRFIKNDPSEYKRISVYNVKDAYVACKQSGDKTGACEKNLGASVRAVQKLTGENERDALMNMVRIIKEYYEQNPPRMPRSR